MMAFSKCTFLQPATKFSLRSRGSSWVDPYLPSICPAPKSARHTRLWTKGSYRCRAAFRNGDISGKSDLHIELEQFSPEKCVQAAVLVSGGGRSLANLCERIRNKQLRNVTISVVIASKKTARAAAIAETFGLPVHVVREKDYGEERSRFSDAITDILDNCSVNIVVLAGWMHFYKIPDRYLGKVINIHPSLIPAFCGKGYYGNRVHEAVLRFGAKITGCTVHLADNEYDHGPIILQKAVEVLDADTVEELAAKVFEAEKEALPEAIQLFADSRLYMDGRIVKIREPTSQCIETVAFY